MKNMMIMSIIGVFVVTFYIADGYADCGMCSSSKDGESMKHMETKKGVYNKVFEKTAEKNGVREITYGQFMKIRKSGEKVVILDVLGKESYESGHISGSENFSVAEINEKTAAERLNKDDKIIVYCGSFGCAASTMAAQKFERLGYTVLDYKGGLKEWQEKGNELEK
ncbi:rhodanese-like domain-containing protein [bacterium]|nr:rhodanese-like domain-containing protein [bacterium]